MRIILGSVLSAEELTQSKQRIESLMKTSALKTHHKVGEVSPPMDMKLSEPHSLNLLAYS